MLASRNDELKRFSRAAIVANNPTIVDGNRRAAAQHRSGRHAALRHRISPNFH
jgi:hypothetical protein